MTTEIRELDGAALDGWDATAVDGKGGHVLQSRAWAEHRAASGWQPRFLAAGDARALALVRPWPVVGGGSAYLPRGPVVDGEPWTADGTGGAVGAALVAASAHLERTGVDVVAADPEVAADDPGYAGSLGAAGFHAIAEIQPSRHRMRLPLPADGDATAIMEGVAKATRQRIRRAERDRVACSAGTCTRRGTPRGARAATEPPAAALGRFFELLRATGERRGFGSPGPRSSSTWWDHALAAGHLVYLEAREGRRTATCSAASCCIATGGDCRPRTPPTAPSAGTTIRAPCTCCAGARSSSPSRSGGPRWTSAGSTSRARAAAGRGEPTYGLYEHKQSFGATWVEIAGAQEHVARAWRYQPAAPRRARPARSVGARRRDRARRAGSVAELLAAAEPAEPRPARRPDRAPARRRPRPRRPPRRPADRRGRAGRRRGPGRHGRLARGRRGHPVRRGARASTSTATTTSPRRRRPARRRRSSSIRWPTPTVPQLVVVGASRAALARAAAWWYGDPSRTSAWSGSPARTARPRPRSSRRRPGGRGAVDAA